MSTFPVGNHGIAIPFYNGTGQVILKGELLALDQDGDFWMMPNPIGNPYMCQGVASNDVQPGAWGQCIQVGMAEFLLEDNVNAFRLAWMRPSLTQAGRAHLQPSPGIEYAPATVTISGVLIDGTTARGSITTPGTVVSDIGTVDGTLAVFREVNVAGQPGINAQIDFTGIVELPSLLVVRAYYPHTHPQGVHFSVWNGTTAVDAVAVPEGSVLTTYFFENFTSNMLIGGTVSVLMKHPDQGVTSHYTYVDAVLIGNTPSSEHFKEVGHCLENKVGGTNVLAHAAIHLL